MAFTVEDFQDLLRLLDQHPEWQDALRRRLLTDELLELPALVRQLGDRLDRLAARVEELAAAQLRTEQRLEELAQAQARTEGRLEELAHGQAMLVEAQARSEQRLEELAQAQARTEGRLEELAAAQARTEARLEELAHGQAALMEAQARTEARLEELAAAQLRTEGRLDRLEAQVGELRGESLQQRYYRRAGAYFGRLMRRARVVEFGTLADLLDDGVDRGQLASADRDEVLNTDLVVRGVRRADGQDVYLLAEISTTIDEHDVERAGGRAGLLARLGRPVIPLVAGNELRAEALARAEEQGVWVMLDGRTHAPPGG